MSAINTAMNVIGTVAGLKSIFGSSTGNTSKGKISKFMSEIRSAGVARTNLFEIVITPPRILLGNSSAAQKISLFAEGAALPGRAIQTQEFARFGYGALEKFPYTMQYQDYTVQFIGDGRGEIYKFFYNWMQGIVKGDADVATNDYAYDVGFREDYAVPISVYMFNEQGDSVLVSSITNAFPIMVPDVNLSWSDSSMMQFSVTFAYTLASIESPDEIMMGKNGTPNDLSTIQKLVKIGTAVQVLSAIRRPGNVQDALGSVNNIKNVIKAF